MTLRDAVTMQQHGGVLVPMKEQRRESTTAEAMVGLLSCVGARRRHEVYLSTPITTGEAFVTWRRRGRLETEHPDYRTLHREHVIDKNLERIRPVVARLRQHYSDRLVIDPTALDDVVGWEQSDYHEFWCAVVATYAAEVVFADGWQFSTGCVAEFAAASEAGIPMRREDLSTLSLDDGLRLATDAVSQLDRLGEDTTGLRRSLRAAGLLGGNGSSA
jgi:hypothetical protein